MAKDLKSVPQGSILVLLFLNILNFLFFFYIETTTLCNYVDDNNMYSSDKNSNIVISILRHDFAIISEWFYENQMVLNPDKYHFLTLGFNEPFSEFLKIPSLKASPGNRFLG